ncbi:hypothetical protein D3C74_135580 [compost metagenome]
MILYLTSATHINLLDFLEKEQELSVKKLTGNFSLLSFVIKDMRHFAHVRYIALDRVALTESDEELIQALLSYQTIYDMRVVLIAEGLSTRSPFLLSLIQNEILNVVTATEIEEIRNELRECFSEEGMQRFKPDFFQPIAEEKSMYIRYEEKEKYQFNCSNLKIAIAGCDRRVGVTTTAMNLVSWINGHGGTACYVEANSNNHLAHIIHLFDPEKIGNSYRMEGNDLYMTEEFNRNYNVIVMDCGVLEEKSIQKNFTTADIQLLCGSAMPYELARLYRAIDRCKDLAVNVLGLFVPNDLKAYMLKAIDSEILFGESSRDLFDPYVNNELYHKLLETYITI